MANQAKATKTQLLLILNAHYLRRLLGNLPLNLLEDNPAGEEARHELNVQLALWLPGWLDELSHDLTGQQHTSPTREKAVSHCLAAIEKEVGLKFPEPLIISTEGLAMSELTKTKPIKKVSAKKKASTKKAATKKTAAKPAAKPIAKAPAATKRAGEFEKQVITLVMKDNPKRVKSEAHKRYELYRKAKTVGDFLQAGGTALDIRYDKAAGYIRLAKP